MQKVVAFFVVVLLTLHPKTIFNEKKQNKKNIKFFLTPGIFRMINIVICLSGLVVYFL